MQNNQMATRQGNTRDIRRTNAEWRQLMLDIRNDLRTLKRLAFYAAGLLTVAVIILVIR